MLLNCLPCLVLMIVISGIPNSDMFLKRQILRVSKMSRNVYESKLYWRYSPELHVLKTSVVESRFRQV